MIINYHKPIAQNTTTTEVNAITGQFNNTSRNQNLINSAFPRAKPRSIQFTDERICKG